jgi:hypothetical protein
MGFSGVHDVCFNTWIAELQAVTELENTPDAAHVFDEGGAGCTSVPLSS